jgi:hypothetical protein
MSEAEFLTTDEAATVMRVPVATMYAWRRRGFGPVGARVGARVLYRRTDVESFIAKRYRDEAARAAIKAEAEAARRADERAKRNRRAEATTSTRKRRTRIAS